MADQNKPEDELLEELRDYVSQLRMVGGVRADAIARDLDALVTRHAGGTPAEASVQPVPRAQIEAEVAAEAALRDEMVAEDADEVVLAPNGQPEHPIAALTRAVLGLAEDEDEEQQPEPNRFQVTFTKVEDLSPLDDEQLQACIQAASYGLRQQLGELVILEQGDGDEGPHQRVVTYEVLVAGPVPLAALGIGTAAYEGTVPVHGVGLVNAKGTVLDPAAPLV